MRQEEYEIERHIGLNPSRIVQSHAYPFHWWQIDNCMNPRAAELILENYPNLRRHKQIKADYCRKKFFVSKPPNDFFRTVYGFFNGEAMVEYLAALSGIPDLTSDRTMRGAGLHEIYSGGFLKVHADFSHHKKTGHKRVLNLLFFLNKDWEDDWRGNLELWRTDMSECAASVRPDFNRAVVFRTTEDSFHGHPDPLSAPKGRSRKAMAFYYYSASLANADLPRHKTIYRSRPGEEELKESAHA